MERPTSPGSSGMPHLVLTLLAASIALPAQESQALLHAPVAVLPVGTAPFQKLGDFDGDGDLDAVGTRAHLSGGSNEVIVWRNDNGAFTQVYYTSLIAGTGMAYGPRSFAVDVADFNGDGLMDFFVASSALGERFVAQPGFQFVRSTYPFPGSQPGKRAVATGDLDADGTADIVAVAASTATTSSSLYVFLSSGPILTTTIGTNYEPRLHALDLDGVGGLDLLVSDRSQGSATVYSVSAGVLVPGLTLTSSLNYSGPTPWLWMGGDIDNDGDVDVVVFKPEVGFNSHPRYQIHRRTGPNTFASEPVAVGGPAEYLVDIDGDGDLDGACCGGGGGGGGQTWPNLDFPSTYELTTNRGGGDFAVAFDAPGAGSESLAGAADLDGDGDVDLVAGRCVYYGDGPWTEAPMPMAGGNLAASKARPRDIHDIDRDGDPDFRLVINRGDGIFSNATPEPAAPQGYRFDGSISCDVDGDGAADRVRRLAQLTPGTPFIAMSWLRNNGGGHFHYAGHVGPIGMMMGAPSAIGVDDAFAADCDGDGDEDIIAAPGQLFWNSGGHFPGPAYVLPIAGTVNGVADFNGDGLPDILMQTNTSIHVLRGTGQAGAWFTNGYSLTTQWWLPVEPCAVVIGDVNGDGRLDFLQPYVDSRVRLFINQTQPGGALNFTVVQLPTPYVALTQPQTTTPVRPTISLGDFDGDGATDIAFGRIVGEPNIGVILRRLTTNPSLHTYETIRLAFINGYAVDADLDGDVDVVGERMVRNRSTNGDQAGARIQKHAGVAGEIGAVPVLGGTGPYLVGGSHTVTLTGVPGPSVAALGLSIGEVSLPNTPLPGLTLYLDPGYLLVATLPITENGHARAAAQAALTLPIFPGVEGWTFYLQAFVFDSAAPQSFSQSNLLTITVGK